MFEFVGVADSSYWTVLRRDCVGSRRSMRGRRSTLNSVKTV